MRKLRKLLCSSPISAVRYKGGLAVFDAKANESKKHLENKTKELQTNVRHLTQLAMTWFAFLVSMNYLTMGWIGGSQKTPLIVAIALVFIVQDGLGIVGIWSVYWEAKKKADIVRFYENSLLGGCNEATKDRSIPIYLYRRIACFLMIVLLCFTLAWIAIAVASKQGYFFMQSQSCPKSPGQN